MSYNWDGEFILDGGIYKPRWLSPCDGVTYVIGSEKYDQGLLKPRLQNFGVCTDIFDTEPNFSTYNFPLGATRKKPRLVLPYQYYCCACQYCGDCFAEGRTPCWIGVTFSGIEYQNPDDPGCTIAPDPEIINGHTFWIPQNPIGDDYCNWDNYDEGGELVGGSYWCVRYWPGTVGTPGIYLWVNPTEPGQPWQWWYFFTDNDPPEPCFGLDGSDIDNTIAYIGECSGGPVAWNGKANLTVEYTPP